MSHRPSWIRVSFFGIILGLVLSALLSGVWYVSARTARTAIDNWIKAEQAKGRVLSIGAVRVSGFPLYITMDLDHIQWRAPDGAGAVVDGARLDITPYRFGHMRVRVAPRGEASLSLPGLPGLLSIKAQHDITGRFVLSPDGHMERADIQTGPIDITRDDAPVLTASRVRIEMEQPSHGAISHQDTDVSYRIDMADMIFAGDSKMPLGPRLRQFRAAWDVLGPAPDFGQRSSVDAWNKASGVIELRSIMIDWVPLMITADGTLSLTPDLQIEGALTAEVAGAPAALNNLRENGFITRDEANDWAKTLNALADQAPRNDGKIRIPLTLQNGAVSLGPLPLMKLPQLSWTR